METINTISRENKNEIIKIYSNWLDQKIANMSQDDLDLIDRDEIINDFVSDIKTSLKYFYEN